MFVTTGVYNSNGVEHLFDDDYIDSEYEQATREIRLQFEQEDESLDSDELDFLVENALDGFESRRLLIGNWIKDEEELYIPDYNGLDGFAYIYNQDYNTIQVAWSKWYIECGPCSPCYPNQGDADNKGTGIFAYALPIDMMCDEWIKENNGRVLPIKEVENVA